MSTRTDAIKAAIEAAELQWLPNPGHEPEIPEGWEIAGARFSDGDEYTVPPNGRILSLADANVTEYAIRRKPTQPSESQGVRAQPTLDQALEQLRIEAERLQQPQSAALVISGRLTSVGETFATILTGTRTLADQLAGVASQQVTLGINTDQARWLGRYVGGEIKLTVEVVL